MTKSRYTEIHIRCGACDHAWTRNAEGMLGSPACPSCRNYRGHRYIRTTAHSEKPCGGRCRVARNNDCDCSCGGENHGIATVAA